MNLTDIALCAGTVAVTGFALYKLYKPFKKDFIPWAEKLEKKYEEHPELDGYRIDGKED